MNESTADAVDVGAIIFSVKKLTGRRGIPRLAGDRYRPELKAEADLDAAQSVPWIDFYLD
jgi:hypothetical protein